MPRYGRNEAVGASIKKCIIFCNKKIAPYISAVFEKK